MLMLKSEMKSLRFKGSFASDWKDEAKSSHFLVRALCLVVNLDDTCGMDTQFVTT